GTVGRAIREAEVAGRVAEGASPHDAGRSVSQALRIDERSHPVQRADIRGPLPHITGDVEQSVAGGLVRLPRPGPIAFERRPVRLPWLVGGRLVPPGVERTVASA